MLFSKTQRGAVLNPNSTMGLSKSTRIMILLGIDTSFFFLELIVGTTELTAQPIPLVLTVCIGSAVHSLALVADSFHMVGAIFAQYTSAFSLTFGAHSSMMFSHSVLDCGQSRLLTKRRVRRHTLMA